MSRPPRQRQHQRQRNHKILIIMKNQLSTLVHIFISTCLICTAAADPFDVLNPRFSGTSQSLHGVTFGNGAYVAVGDNGTILYSTDSITWIPEASGTTNRLNGVKYGANAFVAVGDASTILNSSDGITWSQCSSPVTNKLSAIAYGLGRYVAVGTSGIVVTSTNGVNWNSINTGAPFNFNGVDFFSSFVLVGDSGTIMTSSDGLAWTLRFSGTFSRLNAVSVYHSYQTYSMVAVGDSGLAETSPDGINWTVQTSGTSANLLAATLGASPRFGIVGQGGVFLTVSLDGSSWAFHTSNTSSNLNGILYARGNFLAVGDSGLIQAAIPWLPRDSGTAQPLAAITYGGGSFVAVGGTVNVISTNAIVRSVNGKDWVTVHTGTEGALYGITYGANGYVAVGGLGAVLTSSNGLNWSSQIIGTTANTYYGVASGNGVYVVVGVEPNPFPPFIGTAPVAYRSTDGVNWAGPYVLSAPNGITFANNIFVAVGSGPHIATSPDGITWTTQSSGLWQDLRAVAYGNGIFIAIGNAYATSIDGTNWAPTSNAIIGTSIAYGDEGFIASNGDPQPSWTTTPDGTNWTVRGFDGPGLGGYSPSAPTEGVAFGNGSYVLVGNGISQSAPANPQAMPLLSGQLISQGFRLSAIAQPNYSYRIQSCTNLASSNWRDVFTYTSTQAVTSYIDTDATNRPSLFYRIKTP